MDSRNVWIINRAYALWEQAGRPFGQDEQHWSRAAMEYDLRDATSGSSDGAEVIEVPSDQPALAGDVNPNVLIVEDEPQLRFDTVDFLERAGLRTLEASNADEAMVHMKNNDIAILVTDINMPGSMDGLGLVATVRRRWPATRIIVTSGLIRLSHRDLDDGVAFVPKPAGGLELLNLVARSA
ncbi:response regulator [Rhizobium sp. NPDC090275]|uniref:response regulator n=1 Tax=Rhizobium sp. NPDC090275 TaxID=3364498 RepID=UPI00383B087D